MYQRVPQADPEAIPRDTPLEVDAVGNSTGPVKASVDTASVFHRLPPALAKSMFAILAIIILGAAIGAGAGVGLREKKSAESSRILVASTVTATATSRCAIVRNLLRDTVVIIA